MNDGDNAFLLLVMALIAADQCKLLAGKDALSAYAAFALTVALIVAAFVWLIAGPLPVWVIAVLAVITLTVYGVRYTPTIERRPHASVVRLAVITRNVLMLLVLMSLTVLLYSVFVKYVRCFSSRFVQTCVYLAPEPE